MPFKDAIIHFQGPAKSLELKRRITEELTDTVCRLCGVGRDAVTIYFIDVDRANSAWAGRIRADCSQGVEGTNSVSPDADAKG